MYNYRNSEEKKEDKSERVYFSLPVLPWLSMDSRIMAYPNDLLLFIFSAPAVPKAVTLSLDSSGKPIVTCIDGSTVLLA